MAEAEARLKRILEKANCEMNGSSPWDPQIHDIEAVGAALDRGTLGIGEAYVDGVWDCERVDELIERVLSSGLSVHQLGLSTVLRAAVPHVIGNLQSKDKAKQNASDHYTLDPKLVEGMLGKTMAYSCAYWPEGTHWHDGSEALDEAQETKLDLIARKLDIRDGMRILDIGCGWGSALAFLSEHCDVELVGITPVEAQVSYARKRLPGIRIEEMDYRDLTPEEFGTFDRVFSVGMFEHVGPKNYKTYFDKVSEMLKPKGISLLHTIGAPKTRHLMDPWINTYIFPGGRIPSRSQIVRASASQFDIVDWHEFGRNYDETLMAWNANFQRHWPKLKGRKMPDGTVLDDSFKRMWEYYLLTCAGSFRVRDNLLFQAVMVRPGTHKKYQPQR